jgi:hypothetical protein
VSIAAFAQFQSAIKGNTEGARQIAHRIEGRVGQPVEVSGADGGPLLIETLNAGRERVRAAREKHPKPADLEP